jgi:uncharacterized membrane protein
MNTQRFVFVLLMFLAALQITYYYPQLPQTVASHFDMAGNANGWSSKETFIGIYTAVIVVMLFAYLVLPPLIKYMPVSLISLPKKDYWLAPERREGTFLFFSEQMLLFGNATFLFLIVTFQLAIQANLTDASRFSSETMWILLGGYLLFVAIWLVRFVLKFKGVDKR